MRFRIMNIQLSKNSDKLNLSQHLNDLIIFLSACKLALVEYFYSRLSLTDKIGTVASYVSLYENTNYSQYSVICST